MSKKSYAKKIRGFTLVELLVVIAIIALLVAIVFPAISTALLRGRVTATSVNGRNIHQSIIGGQLADIYQGGGRTFPDGSFASSTEYFTFLVEDARVLNVAWSFFAAPGLTPSQDSLDSDGNAWSVVDDSENLRDTAPFLFTRNLTLGTLSTPTVPGAFDGAPFGTRGFAFVTRGGAAFALVGDDMEDQDRFNTVFVPRDADGSDLGNNVLEP